MKTHLLLIFGLIALTAQTTLIACSRPGQDAAVKGPDSKPYDPGIQSLPETLVLNLESLRPLSDSERGQALDQLTQLLTTLRIEKHILIDQNESLTEKQARLKDYNELQDSQKSALETIHSKCTVIDRPLVARSELLITEGSHTEGSLCPVNLSRRLQTKYTILSSDSSGRNGRTRLDGDLKLNFTFSSEASAAAAQSDHLNLEGSYRGLVVTSPSTSKFYLEVQASLQSEWRQNKNTIKGSLKFARLGTDSNSEMTLNMQIEAPGGLTFPLAAQVHRLKDEYLIEKVYLGTELLSESSPQVIKLLELLRQF